MKKIENLWVEAYNRYLSLIQEFRNKLKQIDKELGTFAEIEIKNTPIQDYWHHRQIREIDLIKIILQLQDEKDN